MGDRDRQPWYRLAFGAAYPVVYAHRDDAEAAAALALAGRLLGPAAEPWLDLGCGQGRHLAALAQAGRRVVGLDLSAALLARAQGDGVAQPLVRADMRRLPFRGGAFGAVLSLFTACGYFGSVEAHLPVVKDVARILRPGGAWLLDFLDSDRVARELDAGVGRRQRRSGPLEVEEVRELLADPRRVVKQVSLRALPGRAREAGDLGVGPDGLVYHEQVTLFSLEELDALAAEAGLRRVAAAGGYDGRPLAPGSSERWILVYRKPDVGVEPSARKDPT